MADDEVVSDDPVGTPEVQEVGSVDASPEVDSPQESGAEVSAEEVSVEEVAESKRSLRMLLKKS